MSFHFILTPDRPIYRSVQSRENLLGEWYTFIPEDGFGYGPITGEFKSTKSLKLLDITKDTFYTDVKYKIMEYSKTDNDVYNNRFSLLFPLGFTDSFTYGKFAELAGISRADTLNSDILLETQYYGNRARCSILNLDLGLIKLLKLIYPEYDGITSPVKLPNILKNVYHHSELCIFNKQYIELVKEIPRLQTGGNMRDNISIEENMGDPIRIGGAIHLDNDFIRKYTESMEKFFKKAKPLPNNSIIEKHLVPHVYVSSTEESVNKNKKRKTRKRKE